MRLAVISDIHGNYFALEFVSFQELLRLREQIKHNHPGQPFDDSTDFIREMCEERSRYLADL